MKKDPIKIVLVLAIIIFGLATFYVGQNKMKQGSSKQPLSSAPLETVEIKPNIAIETSTIDDSESDTEVFLDSEFADSAKEKIFHSLTISKSELQQLTNDMSQVLMSARATPYMNSKDEVTGFQLSDIQPNSLFTKFGFKNRDIVVQVNDQLLQSASGAMTMFSSLNTTKDVKFKIVRGRELGHLLISIRN